MPKTQRDEAIHFIRQYETFEEGLKQWKITSGYHRRSLVKASIFRLKRIFGFNLQLKNEQSRNNEIIWEFLLKTTNYQGYKKYHIIFKVIF